MKILGDKRLCSATLTLLVAVSASPLAALSCRQGHSPCAMHLRSTRTALPDTARAAALDVQPAAVSLSRGRLMIIGHGSDLAQILHSLAAKTGMVFEGASPHARIFGSYGPGAPREVLTQLLGDTGSNFVMTGNMAPGAPLRIMLSPQSKAPPDAPTAPQRRVPVASDNPPTGPPPVHLGPGALAHVPPDELPADQQDRQQRMREHVQRLEQMHQLYQRESENNLP